MRLPLQIGTTSPFRTPHIFAKGFLVAAIFADCAAVAAVIPPTALNEGSETMPGIGKIELP